MILFISFVCLLKALLRQSHSVQKVWADVLGKLQIQCVDLLVADVTNHKR